MKQKLLLFVLFFSMISWGKTTTANPSIGILLAGYPAAQGNFFFTISIKNTGEETLTNVTVTDVSPFPGMQFYFGPIASLAPGEETTNLQAFKNAFCFDQSQVLVTATTVANTQITDLSADPNAWFNPGVLGSYYNDLITDTQFFIMDFGSQEGIYADLNGNNIVDVGDAVNYTYTINLDNPSNGQIYDNNAIVSNPTFIFTNFYTTTGIHYITQDEVNLGYVYNSSGFTADGTCSGGGTFQDASYCACPNPGANVITQLTSLLPNRISGRVQFNANNDNCATGIGFLYRRVNTTDGTHSYGSYTNYLGDYHILIPNTNTYTTTALNNLPNTFSSNPTSVVVTSVGSNVDYNNTDFCIGSAAGYSDLKVSMFNVNEAIPGNLATYRIYYSNEGSTSLNGTIQLTYDNTKLTFANSNLTPSNTTSNTITWNYSNLIPFQSGYITVAMNVAIPPTVNTNDLLNFTVNATPSIDDVPANNTFSWNQTVRSSFDPNDKTVIEGQFIDIGQTGNYLTYVTRFQNTGTANATTVVIKETLDPNLDWNTFEPIDSSHASNIQIKDGNQLIYTFSNIDLPYESANEPASHGWMAYRIKPKSDIALYDIMSSSSNIYFDYNPPVATNTVSTQVTALATADFIKSNFTIYPNPAYDYITIKTEANVDAQYEIVDINGKMLLKNTVESMNPITISSLQSGFYFLTIKTDQGKATYKIIKN